MQKKESNFSLKDYVDTLNDQTHEKNEYEALSDSLRKIVLSDAESFGKSVHQSIKLEEQQNPNNFVDIDQAAKDKKSEFFKMGILAKALQSQGIHAVIKKNSDDPQMTNKNLNMIFSGAASHRKIDIKFDFGSAKDNLNMVNNPEAFTNLKEKIKTIIATKCNISGNNVVQCVPSEPMQQAFVIDSLVPFSLPKLEEIKETLKENSTIKDIQVLNLLEGIELTPEMFDSRGDNDDDGWAPRGETRGPPDNTKEYIPPYGWKGYGLSVYDKYDNGDNSWLDYENVPGEWWIAYHGMSDPSTATPGILKSKFHAGNGQAHEEDDDLNHPGSKVGKGVYCTPDPEVALQYSEGGVGFNGYYVAFMCRVNPKEVRICSEQDDYWVVNGDINSIRPYRLLLKKINEEEEE